MLVLSRKAGESIRIGENITITITKTHGNRVQIGIEAPREVGIRRAELKANPNRSSDFQSCALAVNVASALETCSAGQC